MWILIPNLSAFTGVLSKSSEEDCKLPFFLVEFSSLVQTGTQIICLSSLLPLRSQKDCNIMYLKTPTFVVCRKEVELISCYRSAVEKNSLCSSLSSSCVYKHTGHGHVSLYKHAHTFILHNYVISWWNYNLHKPWELWFNSGISQLLATRNQLMCFLELQCWMNLMHTV